MLIKDREERVFQRTEGESESSPRENDDYKSGLRRGSRRERGAAAALVPLSLYLARTLSCSLFFSLYDMRRGSAGQHGGGGIGGYDDNAGNRTQFGRSPVQFSLSRFRHNDRVALALLPALAVVAGSADATVLWVLLVRREREGGGNRKRG